MTALDLYVREDEHCAALTRDWFILQRRKGHRYSVDDLLVAQKAAELAPGPSRVLDLGCGIGSVLLMVGWARTGARLVGIEAQQESIAMARRNLLLNDCASRCELLHGDLRDSALLSQLGPCDLVTGTPPYFDPKAATPCADPQRAHAKFELRGGIEHYAQAAAKVMAPGGRFVVCAPALPEGRGTSAITAAGLHPVWLQPVLPGPARPAFLQLIVAAHEPEPLQQAPPLVLREADGRRSAEHARIREWFGLVASEY